MNPADQHLEFARSLFREANDAFFLFDPRTRIIIDLNPAAMRMTGLEKTAACSMRLEEFFSGATPERLERLLQALDKTGFFHSREGYFLQRPSRDPLPVNLSVSRIHTQPETIGLVVARDISERKQAEEALRQVETRFKSLVASTGVIVWEIDAGGVLRSISPAFQDITGWPTGDWIGEPLGDLIHPDDRAAANQMHQRAWQGETLPRYDLRDPDHRRRLSRLRIPAGHPDSGGLGRACPGDRPRYHRAEADREGGGAGRKLVPG